MYVVSYFLRCVFRVNSSKWHCRMERGYTCSFDTDKLSFKGVIPFCILSSERVPEKPNVSTSIFKSEGIWEPEQNAEQRSGAAGSRKKGCPTQNQFTKCFFSRHLDTICLRAGQSYLIFHSWARHL